MSAKELVSSIELATALKERTAKSRIKEMKELNIIEQGDNLKYTICTNFV